MTVNLQEIQTLELVFMVKVLFSVKHQLHELKLSKIVTLSSTEAEYYHHSEGAKELFSTCSKIGYRRKESLKCHWYQALTTPVLFL
jgi:hypothetical protein